MDDFNLRITHMLALLDGDISPPVKNAILQTILHDLGIEIPTDPSNMMAKPYEYIDWPSGISNTATGLHYLQHSGSLKDLQHQIKYCEKELYLLTNRTSNMQIHCDKLNALQMSVIEVINVHELVKTDYEEIIADAYLRNNT